MNRRAWPLATAALAVVGAMTLAGCASMSAPPKTLVDAAASNPETSTLAKLINDAGLADTLRGPGPFTVFAPTNDAFSQLSGKTMQELAQDKDRLRAVLAYHVVAGRVMAAEVKSGNVKTMNGAELPLSRSGAFVGVDQALVTKADISAANGVIHVIDRVVLPPAPRR